MVVLIGYGGLRSMHENNNMPRRAQQTFLLNAKSKEYKDNIAEAKRNIKSILETEKPMLLYSGGKDSLVLLHMAMEIDDSIPCYYNDNAYDYESQQVKMPASFTEDILRIGYQTGAKKIIVGKSDSPSSKVFFQTLHKHMRECGCTVEMLGIRGGESVGRKNRVKGSLVKRENVRRVCFPIRNLTWEDIWTYLITNDIEYLSYYDLYAKVDGYENVRLTSRFSNGLLYKGGSKYFDGVLLSEFRDEKPEK